MILRWYDTRRVAPVTIFALLAALSFFTFGLYTSSQYALYKEQVEARLNDDMHRVATAIDSFFIRNVSIFRTIAGLPAIVDQNAERASDIFRHLNEIYPQIANAAAVDKHGRFFASGRPFDHNNPPSIADLPFFQKIRDGSQLMVMEPHLGPITKTKVTGIALPIHDHEGHFNGLLGGSIQFEELVDLVEVLERELRTQLLVLDRNGVLQLASAAFSRFVETKLPDILRQVKGHEKTTIPLEFAEQAWIVRTVSLSDSDFQVISLASQPSLVGFLQQSPFLLLVDTILVLLLIALSCLLFHEYRLQLRLSRQEQEQRALEEQLRQSRKMEMIGTLTGGIAHDFNNILSAIIGYSEITLHSLPEDAPIRDDIGKILQAGNRAKTLVQQLLAFSRIQPQHQTVLLIQQTIEEALQLLRASLPVTIAIETDIDPECPPVLADATQMHQIVMNLCTNGAQALTDGQGTISISLFSTRGGPTITGGSGAGKNTRYAVLRVCDTGRGIPSDVRERIFEPYFTTKKSGEGTGLGLATVHGIVKSHGGHIEVHDNEPCGVCFFIYLPCTGSDSTPNRIADDYSQPLPQGSERLLVVDDEEEVLQMMQKLLMQLGYTVTCVRDGLDGLNLFESNPDAFDLVITDQTMPHMTGDVLAASVCAIRKDLPVIICTGFSPQMDQQKIKEVGAAGLLLKPVSKKELAVAVRRALDRKPDVAA